jgi:hypothetical protein
LPKYGNQVPGYAASRARSILAYLQGMSRHSLRGSLHLGLLVTALKRSLGFTDFVELRNPAEDWRNEALPSA